MQHTPGPWTFTLSNDVPIDDRIIGANNCSVMRGCIPNTPDALLIAAAPAMLDALLMALPHLEAIARKDNACYSLARAAIAQAQGGDNE